MGQRHRCDLTVTSSAYNPLSDQERTSETRWFLKIFNFKNGIGIKGQKCMQTS